LNLPSLFRRSPPVDTKAAETSTIASPSDWLMEIFGIGSTTSAGAAVTPSNAMRCTAVRRAVQAIAEPIGSLPLHVYRRNGEAKDRDPDHPVAKVLRNPNPWSSGQDLREQVQRDCLLHGNGFCFVNRVGGKPRELLRLDPTKVTVLVDTITGEPSYRVTETGGQRTVKARDMLHLKAPSRDGYVGDSIVLQCREAVGIALVLEKHVGRLFSEGARPSGVIEIPNKVGESALAKMKAAWQSAHGGSANSGGTAVLFDGAKFNPLTFKSTDAQTLELWRHSTAEIARAFGVPPTLLFDLDRATWSNSESFASYFVTFTLMHWVKAWQNEIALKLFNDTERDTYFAEFLIEDLLKADLAARASAYSTLITARVMNPNECRARENLPPYPEGNEFLNPAITSAPSGAEDTNEQS